MTNLQKILADRKPTKGIYKVNRLNPETNEMEIIDIEIRPLTNIEVESIQEKSNVEKSPSYFGEQICIIGATGLDLKNAEVLSLFDTIDSSIALKKILLSGEIDSMATAIMRLSGYGDAMATAINLAVSQTKNS